ncbi:MAG TPA: phospho-N-acetylmuramoyl-pentapeptide-transferase [Candidatus Methanoperedens sp.]|nr:phospho-N-acetylmuramoyl-pentapeptide-transferase [Candidatus Methanoperedens sp.]
MLYHLLFPLHQDFAVFNVFRYITFRAAYAALTALAMSLLLGPWVIRTLAGWRVGQLIRAEGPASHQVKAGTPTMGGLLILFCVAVPTLLWGRLDNRYLWLVLATTLAFGAIGFADDYLKLVRRRSLGLSGRWKFAAQVLAAFAFALALAALPGDGFETRVGLPFLKNVLLDLGWLYPPFVVLVLTGASNAVNLTDGLDGLATGTTLVVAAFYTVVTYLAGNAIFARYLQIVYVEGAGELAVFCGALLGAGMGFLWFNAHPASVFMGDTGSLALGAALGSVAVIAKHEVLLVLVGGVFVLEALSVMIQVLSFRLTGRRIFLMAPIHHHFEKLGWAESKIIVRFWIVAIIFALLSLSTLKLR